MSPNTKRIRAEIEAGLGAPTRRHGGMSLRAIQWPEFQHGVETWLLWSNGKKQRVEKIDGKWTLEQLGLVVDTTRPTRA